VVAWDLTRVLVSRQRKADLEPGGNTGRAPESLHVHTSTKPVQYRILEKLGRGGRDRSEVDCATIGWLSSARLV